MNLKDAFRIKEENEGLIGTIRPEGKRIVDVFVAPVEGNSFAEFLGRYRQSGNNLQSVMPYADQELTVKVQLESVDNPSINGYFMHSELT